MTGRFVRLAEADRRPISIHVDGQKVEALEGDTLMVALLGRGSHLRQAEFGPETRAGFCLMGACQDCVVRTEAGDSLRACSTLVAKGMRIVTTPLEATWSNLA